MKQGSDETPQKKSKPEEQWLIQGEERLMCVVLVFYLSDSDWEVCAIQTSMSLLSSLSPDLRSFVAISTLADSRLRVFDTRTGRLKQELLSKERFAYTALALASYIPTVCFLSLIRLFFVLI